MLIVLFSDELVQAGWSKCWSRRENRPYYFNKFTNQSLWEMPVFGQHDIIVSNQILRVASFQSFGQIITLPFRLKALQWTMLMQRVLFAGEFGIIHICLGTSYILSTSNRSFSQHFMKLESWCLLCLILGIKLVNFWWSSYFSKIMKLKICSVVILSDLNPPCFRTL